MQDASPLALGLIDADPNRPLAKWAAQIDDPARGMSFAAAPRWSPAR